MSSLCLNHLQTCLAMMVLGQWLTPHVPLSLSSSKDTHNRTQCFILCCLFSLINHFVWLGSTFSISRYGNQVYADELDSLYGESRAKGLGSEVHTFQSFLISNLAASFFGSIICKYTRIKELIQFYMHCYFELAFCFQYISGENENFDGDICPFSWLL